jgi:ABC-type thiamin/hydroxymethylpyrimidine transport system permease subunit
MEKMGNPNKFDSQKIAVVVLFSSLGAILSLAVGYAGKFFSFTPLGPVAGQLLAGFHVLCLILVAAIVRSKGAATLAGALMGTLEMFLPNHLGIVVLLLSLLEGVVIDLALLPFNRPRQDALLVAAGLSSTSNIVILQAFQILPVSLSPIIIMAMYGAAFLSGLILGGLLGLRILNALEPLTSRSERGFR